MATVREIALPPAARALSTLDRVDYEDAFRIEFDRRSERTPEEWARVILEGAPASFRAAAPRAWFALGLKHGPAHSDAFVLGWPVRRSSPEYTLLGAESRIGMPAELLVKPEATCVLFSTMIEHRNPIMRAVWAPIAAPHRRIVRQLLERASSR